MNSMYPWLEHYHALMKTCRHEHHKDPSTLAEMFFGGKVRMSPEMIYDMWIMYMIHPDILLDRAQRQLCNLYTGEEIDFHCSINKFDVGAPLVTSRLKIMAVMITDRKKMRLLDEFYYEAPADMHLDEGSKAGISYAEWLPPAVTTKKKKK